MQGLLRAFERALIRVELGIVIVAFAAMLALSLADIVGRNVLRVTVPDGDLMLRQLVLWVALPGALLAAAARRHLALDPANLAERPGWQRWTALPFNLFSAGICGLLAHAAWRYWQDEFATAELAWMAWSSLLLPVAFGLLALHFVLRAVILRPDPSVGLKRR